MISALVTYQNPVSFQGLELGDSRGWPENTLNCCLLETPNKHLKAFFFRQASRREIWVKFYRKSATSFRVSVEAPILGYGGLLKIVLM